MPLLFITGEPFYDMVKAEIGRPIQPHSDNKQEFNPHLIDGQNPASAFHAAGGPLIRGRIAARTAIEMDARNGSNPELVNVRRTDSD